MDRVLGFNAEDSKDGFLSAVGLIDRVLEAEEKRGPPNLAALFADTRHNQAAKDPTCTLQYFALGHSTCR